MHRRDKGHQAEGQTSSDDSIGKRVEKWGDEPACYLRRLAWIPSAVRSGLVRLGDVYVKVSSVLGFCGDCLCQRAIARTRIYWPV